MDYEIKQTSEFQNWAVPSHRKLVKVLDIQKLKISVSSLSGNRGKLKQRKFLKEFSSIKIHGGILI